MMKSHVLIPAGSYIKTIKDYLQPIKDTVSFAAAYDPVSPVPPNNDPGGEWLDDSSSAVVGATWYYFARGVWNTLTKISAV